MQSADFISWVKSDAHSEYGIKKIIVPEDLKEQFYTWFFKNGQLLEMGNSVNDGEFKQMQNHFEIEPGLCFGNSQKTVIIKDTLNYAEGFYHVKEHDEWKAISRHAFNLEDDKIKDYTAYAGKLTPLKYFGVLIPQEFVLKMVKILSESTESFLKDRNNRSLLRHYFFSSIERQDLFSNNWFLNPEL